MGRHLTTAERAGLAALLADAGPHEVLITVAGWIANNVTDLATGDRLATEIRRAAKDLATLYVAREGEPATELATCDTCHQTIRWVPGVLTPPEGAPQPPRVCRKCTDACAQAKREGRPITVYRRDRALVTFFPDGASVPAVRDDSGAHVPATAPEAVPAPVARELSDEQIVEALNETPPADAAGKAAHAALADRFPTKG